MRLKSLSFLVIRIQKQFRYKLTHVQKEQHYKIPVESTKGV